MTTTIIEKDNLENGVENDSPYVCGFMISGNKPILHDRIILKTNNESEEDE